MKHVTKANLRELHGQLLKMQEESSGYMKKRRAEIEAEGRAKRQIGVTVRDMMESAENSIESNGADLMEFHAKRLDAIEDALKKLAAGTYGVCVECSEPISITRLQAAVFTENCIECQEELESRMSINTGVELPPGIRRVSL